MQLKSQTILGPLLKKEEDRELLSRSDERVASLIAEIIEERQNALEKINNDEDSVAARLYFSPKLVSPQIKKVRLTSDRPDGFIDFEPDSLDKPEAHPWFGADQDDSGNNLRATFVNDDTNTPLIHFDVTRGNKPPDPKSIQREISSDSIEPMNSPAWLTGAKKKSALDKIRFDLSASQSESLEKELHPNDLSAIYLENHGFGTEPTKFKITQESKERLLSRDPENSPRTSLNTLNHLDLYVESSNIEEDVAQKFLEQQLISSDEVSILESRVIDRSQMPLDTFYAERRYSND